MNIAFCLFQGHTHSSFISTLDVIETKSTALRDTVRVHYKTRIENIQSHQAWWKLKLAWLHSIMLPLHLLDHVSNTGKQTLFSIRMTLMTQLLPIIKTMAYIVGVVLAIPGELNEELIHITLRLRFYKVEKKPPWEPSILRLGAYHRLTPPLPCWYMILSGV